MAKQAANGELFEAIKLIESEKGIPREYLVDKVSTAIISAVKKEYGGRDVVFCDINIENESFKIYVRKTVVDEIEDQYSQILPEEAFKYNKKAMVGDFVDIPLDSKQFGRIIAQNAKQIIRQGIIDKERGKALEEFQSRNKELVSAIVQKIDAKTGNATLTIGRSEAVLPKAEQVPDEVFKEGEHIKVFIVDVKEGEKGSPRVMISRTHPGLVKRLFEMEVPEIFDGTIQVKSVSRQAGSRTKMAVFSENEDVDAVGACIGQRGARVNKIVEELGGEKIDIIKYSDDPVVFIAESLSPSKVLSVEIVSDNPKVCRVTVPDSQLSLAIGNKGQNVRLAARLTGWKIDIRPESGFFGEDDKAAE
ncbi:MAG: transcription termination factor NusA [Oscillospiraceae bacterium]|nr:transcription termination factor NusA [Oscillospiraceae bacterium]